MSRVPPLASVICAVVLCFGLGGCAGAILVGGLGAAAGGGYMAAQERGANGTYNDFNVKTSIEQGFLQTNPLMQKGVTTSVYDGRVLLTGRAPTPELKTEAIRIARAIPGVRSVYDEIEIAPVEGLWDNAQDTWITARVRSALVLDPDIRSGNYTIDTEDGSVYLIGSARTQYELDRAVRIARYVPGVRRVVSYVEIRSGLPVAAVRPAEASHAAPALNPLSGTAPAWCERLGDGDSVGIGGPGEGFGGTSVTS
jgi:osmotically-inducible protein OsmY